MQYLVRLYIYLYVKSWKVSSDCAWFLICFIRYEALHAVPGAEPDFHRLEKFGTIDISPLLPGNQRYIFTFSPWCQGTRGMHISPCYQGTSDIPVPPYVPGKQKYPYLPITQGNMMFSDYSKLPMYTDIYWHYPHMLPVDHRYSY